MEGKASPMERWVHQPEALRALPIVQVQLPSTIAGSTSGFADGTSATAQFNGPYGVAIDTEGNIYIADKNNNKIRKMVPELWR